MNCSISGEAKKTLVPCSTASKNLKRRPTIEWCIYGTPVPQPRPRISMRGGFAKAYTPADHPIVAFRKAVGVGALRRLSRQEWVAHHNGGPVRVEVWCVFVRPKSHYGKKGTLKPEAPLLPRPDVDNLAKGVLDALTTCGVLSDDVVVKDVRCKKRYVSAKIPAHTVVRVL